MRSRVFVLALLSLALLMAPSPAAAAGVSVAQYPICVTAGEQVTPDVSGDIVVWADCRAWPGSPATKEWDIYGYNLTTKTEFPICTAEGSQINPVVDGSYVVWEEQRFSGDMYSDIYGYDLATGTEFPVCTAIGGQHNPAISGNTVVWDDERDGTFNPLYLEYQGNDNIYGFNLKTSSEFPVCLDAGDQTHPSISVSNVVWQWNDGIKGVDLSTSVQFLVVAGSYIYAPAISEARVVWTQQLGGSSHLLGYDLDSATAFSVAASGGQPSISGDCVTWSTGSGSAQGVYGSYLVTGEQFLVSAAAGSQYNDAISGYTVVWQDERNANWDIYGATLTYPDTTRPTTRAYAARGRANGRVALRFRVTDPLPSCGKATVKIQIRKRSKVVRTIRIGTRRVNAKLTYRFKATLKRGQYTWRVLATDVAGHRATRMVSARLVVK